MFACEICDRQFLYKNSVNRHFRREHINKESRRRLKCTECDHECRFYQDLRTHIYVEHGIVCNVFRRTFSDFEEFKTWKRKFEETTHFMYVKHSSPKTSQTTQERKTYFVCHRTGNFQSGSCGKRKLKRQGSNKINASCPSTMEVVESLADGTVKLVLWKTHVGHDAEVSRTFLSATERNWLAARISEGASYQKIMDDVQNLGSKGGRMSYIKSQDIRNMRKHLINARNRVILSNIRSWVRNSQNLYYCENNPILSFKDRNTADPHRILSSKDIMLVLMTEFQEAAFRELNPTILCLDDTHCQDSFDFCLISLYGTVSEGHAWFPIAYCFTNAVNMESLKYFLTRIRDRFGVLECSALICDDCPLYFNAWCDVMSPPNNYFLHLWYIEKNWLENVSKIKCTETDKQMICETMKLLLTERSEAAFEKRLATFQEKLKSDARLSEFWDFFVSDYVTRTNVWGGCYRKSVGLDTASEFALTELHDKLHEEFSSKLDDQNIQACFNTLISISHSCEAVLKHIHDMSECEQEEYKQRIQSAHKSGVFIKRTQILETTATKYQIVYKHENGRNEIFDVGYLGAKKCKCVLKCNTCMICIHHYNCTCVDYVANFNICEHIHACAIIRNDIKVDLSVETDVPLDSFVEEVICEEEIVCHVDLTVGEDIAVDEVDNYVNCRRRCDEEESISSDVSSISIANSPKEEIENDEEIVFDDTVMKTNEELSLGSTSSLYYEPFTFVSDDMDDYGQAELQLTDEGLQIVAFRNEDEYEAVLVNEDDSSSFGDVSSVYEDVIPSKGAIITLGFRSDVPDGYLFRPFENNAVIKHKVDTLFTLPDFDDMGDTEIGKQLSSQMISMDNQDFQNCYTSYDPADDENNMIIVERKSKRKPKPSEHLLNIDDIGESSDDSDFRIEDHDVLDSDFSGDSSGSESVDEDDSDEETDQSLDKKPSDTQKRNGNLFNELPIDVTQIDDEVIKHVMICCVCLGDRSDDSNEIIECDGCNITVHEGCCGVQDTASLSSTVSSCSTEPWFCEACRAGVTDPICELCPNFGGIFKETDIGKWVHLVCALYVPGIAFGDPDKLSNITLFEISSTKWGNKECQLCQDSRFSRTGMTIECDAGMCRAYFHVTCGQRDGLLSEAASEEVEQADPFYAHCKLHSDKNQIKQRKRNWLALQHRMKKMVEFRDKEISEESSCWKRNQRKLSKYRGKYTQLKLSKVAPWVPMQKRPRLITTSASACRTLWRKAELMGVDISSFEETESLLNTLQDIPKKWHIPPALSVEFIGYFLDRDSRVNRLKKQTSHHGETKARLTGEQQKLQQIYDTAHSENLRANQMHISMKNTITFYHDIIHLVRQKAKLPDVETIGEAAAAKVAMTYKSPHYLAKSVRKAVSALKPGTGPSSRIPNNHQEDVEKLPVRLNNKCGICAKSNDQHLLAKCDTCGKFYHLGCLDPPLTRMPKKTKLMGWQCSECDRESSCSEIDSVDADAPRKLRRSSKERETRPEESIGDDNLPVEETKKNKKRRRDKHRARYSPEFVSSQTTGKHHSRKRKRKSSDLPGEQEPPRQGIKLFIKSVPNSSGQANFIATPSSSNGPTFVAKTEEYVRDTEMSADTESCLPRVKKKSVTPSDIPQLCDTCKNNGTSANMVSCDECGKNFHFHCLDPPVKKSPKVRGYSWHCANCDPTETDSD